MPLQYLYPIADKTYSSNIDNGWILTGGYGPYFWSGLDDSVYTPFDSEYTYNNSTTTPGVITQPLSMYFTDNINYIPSSIYVYVKYQNNVPYDSYMRNVCLFNYNNEIIASSSLPLTFIYSSHLDYVISGQLIINTGCNNYSKPYLSFATQKTSPSYVPNSNLRINAIELLVSGNSLLPNSNAASLYINGHQTIEGSGQNLFVDGNTYHYDKLTLYTGHIVYQSGDIPLSIYGVSGKVDEDIPLFITTCHKTLRLQPLYDNKLVNRNAEYGQPNYIYTDEYYYSHTQDDGIENYWNFYNQYEYWTEKLHFAIDDADTDFYKNSITANHNNTYNNIRYYTYIFPGSSPYVYVTNAPFYYNPGYFSNRGYNFYSNSGHYFNRTCNVNADVLIISGNQSFMNFDYLSNSNDNNGFINKDYGSVSNLSLWFKIDSPNQSGTRKYLFTIKNYNTTNDTFAVFYNGDDNRLYLDDAYSSVRPITYNLDEYTGDGNGWHSLFMNLYSFSSDSFIVDAYLDTLTNTPFINLSCYQDFNNNPGDNFRRLILGARDYFTNNIGDLQISMESLFIDDGHSSYFNQFNVFYYGLADYFPVGNYLNTIGCNGWYDCGNDAVGFAGGDNDYIYSRPPLSIGGIDLGYYYGHQTAYSNVYNNITPRAYFYDNYNPSQSLYETTSVVDFISRGISLSGEMFNSRLRFRADIDFPFIVDNISLQGKVNGGMKTLSTGSGAYLLDGYGTCGLYEIPLINSDSMVGTDWQNVSETLIHCHFHTNDTAMDIRFPTGLVDVSQTGNNFYKEFRNHRLRGNGAYGQTIYDSGNGINNGVVNLRYYKPSGLNIGYSNTTASLNTFGYEFSGINNTAFKNYVGIKVVDATETNSNYLSNASVDVYVYINHNSGSNYISHGTLNIQTHDNYYPDYYNVYGKNPLTYWVEVPTGNDMSSGFQVGCRFRNSDSLYDNQFLEQNITLSPFVYIDTTNKGVDRLGMIKLTQLDVALEVDCSPTGISNTMPLFTVGGGHVNSGTDMSISGNYNKNTTLFVKGGTYSRDNLDLFVRGAAHQEMPLFIQGMNTNGNTESHTITSNTTLFMQARESGYLNISTELYINNLPTPYGDGLNLYIAGPESGFMYDTLSLFVENDNFWTNINSGTDMYLQAMDSGNNYGELFVKARDAGVIGDGYNSNGEMFSLYITAPTSGNENQSLNLFIQNNDSTAYGSGGFNLYLQTLESGNNSTPLFMKARDFGVSGDMYSSNDYMNLYIDGTGAFNNNTLDLYTLGGYVNNNNIPLFIPVATPSSGNLNLYMSGWGSSGNKTTTMFVEGSGGKSKFNTDLYILGPSAPVNSGYMNLFIEGGGTDFRQNSTELIINGGFTGDFINSIDLSILGGFENSTFNLSVYNDKRIFDFNKNISLSTDGYNPIVSGVLKNIIPLTITGDVTYDSINLFVENLHKDIKHDNMNLYMPGTNIIYDKMLNSTALTVYNNYNSTINSQDLMIYARQNYENSGNMNLFMSREFDSIAHTLGLYMSAPAAINSDITLFISGGTDGYNSCNLALPSSIGHPNISVNMYSHGF